MLNLLVSLFNKKKVKPLEGWSKGKEGYLYCEIKGKKYAINIEELDD